MEICLRQFGSIGTSDSTLRGDTMMRFSPDVDVVRIDCWHSVVTITVREGFVVRGGALELGQWAVRVEGASK